MGPTVRRIMKEVPWSEGVVFSPDGATRIGDGSWLKRQWHAAQVRADIKRPIRWHDLRHQFVSLLIATGKNPLYHQTDAGEWPEDLLWPSGCDQSVTALASKSPHAAGDRPSDTNTRSRE